MDHLHEFGVRFRLPPQPREAAKLAAAAGALYDEWLGKMRDLPDIGNVEVIDRPVRQTGPRGQTVAPPVNADPATEERRQIERVTAAFPRLGEAHPSHDPAPSAPPIRRWKEA